MAALGDVFRALNEMKAAGVVEEYAIGGAMAALFYTEATRTFDLDVFVLLPVSPGQIVRLTEIYRWAETRGFESRAEHLLIHRVPVQFLVAGPGLEKEAVLKAESFDYQEVPVRVIGPEHLIALFVQAGGERRRERIRLMVEAEIVDSAALEDILQRHGLAEEWGRRFGEGNG